MDEVVFLEVMEGDSVHARHRLERFPVTVGRGYGNDVILDDPKVSTAHLRIERAEDGRLWVRDVGSRNGTYRVEPWAPLAEMVLESGARVAVGDTVLRFRGRGHAVERTWVGAAPDAPRRRLFDAPWMFPSALGGLLAVSVLSEHLANYQKTDWGQLLLSLVVPLAMAFAWAGCWAVASRIARKQFHFLAHAAIGSMALLGVTVLPMLLSLVGFSLSVRAGQPWLYQALYLGLLGWTLYWHLRYVTRWDSRRLRWSLVGITLFFGVASQADALLGEEGFSTELPFERTLLPPALRLAPARPVDSFFEHTDTLQRQVDALAKEE